MYLPGTDSPKYKGKFNNSVDEGIIRLDRMFSSTPHHYKISPTNIKISDEYFSILRESVNCLLTESEGSEDFRMVKELCQESS